ncbi:MAG: hypothetical protein E7342_04915 [Clostridiales bacterium]|nr:hypothetical protein [Clostridiales bacterium]
MNNYITLLILAIFSYLLGSVNFAIIISKIKNKDIRDVGSGNPGTLNMSRNFGLGLGLLTFFLDVLKGAIPALVSFFIFRNKFDETGLFNLSHLAIYVCGFSAILGHIYPVFLKFKGGKGIATTIGVLLVCECTEGLAWAIVAVMAIVAAVAFIYITEFGAMGSFIAITPPAICGGIRLYLYYGTIKEVSCFYIITSLIILLICFFTWFAHRKNIERMLAGEEHPTSIKQLLVKAKSKKKKQLKESKTMDK